MNDHADAYDAHAGDANAGMVPYPVQQQYDWGQLPNLQPPQTQVPGQQPYLPDLPAPDHTWRAQVLAEGEQPATVLVPPPNAQLTRDPSRTAMAAVITFICMIVGLWAVLAYMHAMAVTLSSVDSSNRKVILQLKKANSELIMLDKKTQSVKEMNKNAAALATLMVGIDKDMGVMLTDVDDIGRQMGMMNNSLATLDSEITQVQASNVSIAGKLGEINTGLKAQAGKVQGMRKDEQATAKVLQGIPHVLMATNQRLTFVNRVVCYIGVNGLEQNLNAKFYFLNIPNGSADVKATILPAGGWTC